MSHYRVVPTSDGWINTVIMTEQEPEEMPADARAVEAELGAALMHAPMIAHHDGERVCMPHDDRVLWRLLRANGLDGATASDTRALVRHLRATLPDTAPDVRLPAAAAMHPPDTPVHDFSEVPGLCLRPLRHDDLDLMAPLAIETGVYPACCPEDAPCCSPPEAHTWCQLASRIDQPTTWQLVLEFNGRPLQFELVYLDPLHPTVTLTFHMTRERPHWFWREAERPVFEALRARGYQHLWTRTRKDRPDWINALKLNYRATEVTELEHTKVLEFPLDTTLFQGWPARRSAGDAWSWTHAPTRLTVREMAPDELAGIRRDLAQSWGRKDHPALPNVRRICDEQWALDRATMLVAVRDGILVGAFSLRQRRETVVHSAVLTRFGDPAADPVARLVYRGVCEWAHQVGYQTLTGMIPDAVYNSASFRRALQHTRAQVVTRHTRFRTPMVEVAHDLAAIAQEPVSAWERWRAEPELPRAEDIK
jgi:hypothetical protein